MNDNTKPSACVHCGGEPWFVNDGNNWQDDRRYVQMALRCCAEMTSSIGWHKARDMTPEARTAEMKKALIEKWNGRTEPDEPEQDSPQGVAIQIALPNGWSLLRHPSGEFALSKKGIGGGIFNPDDLSARLAVAAAFLADLYALAQTKQAKTATVPSPEVTAAVLTEAIAELHEALKVFPITLRAQSFCFNGGPLCQADGDTEFYSKKKVLTILTKLHDHINKALNGSQVSPSNPTQDNPG